MKQSFLMFECDYTKPFIFSTLTLPLLLKKEAVLYLGCVCSSATDNSDRIHMLMFRYFYNLRHTNVLSYYLIYYDP